MGNIPSSRSSSKDEVIQNLWKTQRAIPVLPVNPILAPLRVLTKRSDGYHDVGNVVSLCKDQGREWLKETLSPSKHKDLLLTKTMSNQSFTISDYNGEVTAKLISGVTWFENDPSIEVYIPQCSVREYNREHWDEMIKRFNPDMKKLNSILKNPDLSGKRELFIIQKVVLVSHIKITVKYNTGAPLDLKSPLMLPSGVQIKPRYLDTDTVEFTISATQKNHKLPIAFSGSRYSYDKFGVQDEKETRPQYDSVGASSSHSGEVEEDEDHEDEQDEDEEEDIAANDAEMGDFMDDWSTSVISSHDPKEFTIFDKVEEDAPAPPPAPPASPDRSPDGSPRRDLEDID